MAVEIQRPIQLNINQGCATTDTCTAPSVNVGLPGAGTLQEFRELAHMLGPELERAVLAYVRRAVPNPQHVPTGLELAARIHTLVNTALSLAIQALHNHEPSSAQHAADARAHAVLQRLLNHLANIGLLSPSIPPLTDAIAGGDASALQRLARITQHTVEAAGERRSVLAKTAATVTACVADSLVFLMEDPEASIEAMHNTPDYTVAKQPHLLPPGGAVAAPTQQPLHRLSVSSLSPPEEGAAASAGKRPREGPQEGPRALQRPRVEDKSQALAAAIADQAVLAAAAAMLGSGVA